MAKYLIEEVKLDQGKGGMACGPVSGPVIGEVKVKGTDEKEFYLSLAEVDGLANFYKTERSTIKDQLNDDWTDEFLHYMNDHFLDDVGDYYDLFEKCREDELYEVYRYLIYLVRSEEKDVQPFIKKSVGKYADEIDIPVSDIEEEYNEEEEEE